MLPSEELKFPFVCGTYLFGEKNYHFSYEFLVGSYQQDTPEKKDYLILGDAADTKGSFAVMPPRDIVFQD